MIVNRMNRDEKLEIDREKMIIAMAGFYQQLYETQSENGVEEIELENEDGGW